MSEKKQQPQPWTTPRLLGYLPIAFLWWIGIIVVSIPVLDGIDGAGNGLGAVGAMFLCGWVAACFGIPVFVHRTWKIAVAMFLVAIAIVIVLVTLFILAWTGGKG